MEYRIKDKNLHNYAIRETLKFVVPLLLFLIIFLSVLVNLVTDGLNIFHFLRGKGTWILLFLIYLVGMTYYLRRNFAKSVVYWVSNDQIAMTFDQNKLSSVSQFGMARNKSRFGTNAQQFIRTNEISSVKFSKSGIKIKSNDYNFFNGNGLIILPKEIENFENLEQQIEKFNF